MPSRAFIATTLTPSTGKEGVPPSPQQGKWLLATKMPSLQSAYQAVTNSSDTVEPEEADDDPEDTVVDSVRLVSSNDHVARFNVVGQANITNNHEAIQAALTPPN